MVCSTVVKSRKKKRKKPAEQGARIARVVLTLHPCTGQDFKVISAQSQTGEAKGWQKELPG